jgi:hypothetical protein
VAFLPFPTKNPKANYLGIGKSIFGNLPFLLRPAPLVIAGIGFEGRTTLRPQVTLGLPFRISQ